MMTKNSASGTLPLNCCVVGAVGIFTTFGCGNAADSPAPDESKLGDNAPLDGGTGGDASNTAGGGTGGSPPGATGGATSGAGGATGGAGTGGASTHGSLDMVAHFRPGSAWDHNDPAQAAVETLFADYENNIRTGGDFNAKIEVCFDDQAAAGAFGYVEFAADAPAILVDYRGTKLRATSVWSEIVLGTEDPNGDPDAAQTKGCDFYLQFDFSQSQPESNIGLVRHECVHGFGADVGVDFAVMSPSSQLDFPAEGSPVVPTVHDLNIVDANGNHLVEFDATSGQYKIGAIQFNSTFGEWTDPLSASAGTFFLGTNDDGTDLKMPNETRPCPWDQGSACDFFNEMPKLMKTGGDISHPTWNTLEFPDRAWLRAMGYTVAMDLE